jgi:hypothetical protein
MLARPESSLALRCRNSGLVGDSSATSHNIFPNLAQMATSWQNLAPGMPTYACMHACTCQVRFSFLIGACISIRFHMAVNDDDLHKGKTFSLRGSTSRWGGLRKCVHQVRSCRLRFRRRLGSQRGGQEREGQKVLLGQTSLEPSSSSLTVIRRPKFFHFHGIQQINQIGSNYGCGNGPAFSNGVVVT